MQVNSQNVIEVYKQELANAKHEVILLRLYIKELEQQKAELQQKIAILQQRLRDQSKEGKEAPAN
jgi:predicted RNase H-like nuclease (RuvC/YqgF family)